MHPKLALLRLANKLGISARTVASVNYRVGEYMRWLRAGDPHVFLRLLGFRNWSPIKHKPDINNPVVVDLDGSSFPERRPTVAYVVNGRLRNPHGTMYVARPPQSAEEQQAEVALAEEWDLEGRDFGVVAAPDEHSIAELSTLWPAPGKDPASVK